ncbi:MAG: hypothetical protein EP329_04510 [Deltaproteobacteria bacterium]|nr:MAG: hypothetical protein EP329_04510 [Deltaproteobacteria bacterium]
MPTRRAELAALLGAAAALAWAPAARAEVQIYEGEDASFSLGGYARELTGVQLPAIEGLGLPDSLGISQALVRLEWKLTLGELATVEVHDRFALTVTGSDAALASGLGVGVTPAPSRTVNLRSLIVDEPSTTLEHDLDRLVLRLFLGRVDVAVGRQAISWGTSNLFTVADAWAAFSPFDLDTSQKRGVDALRVGLPLGESVELDLVVADRGSADDLSGGARLTAYLGDADVYLALAKQWGELAVMGGVSAAVDEVKLRGEVWWGAWDLDREEVLNPRATIGVDWFHGDLTLSVEAHYNGAGAERAGDYVALAATSPELARGEIFWLGRYYAGAAAVYKLTEQLTFTVSLLSNLGDPSLLVVSALRYDVAENVDLGIGAFDGIGGGADLSAGGFESELGAYGHLVYLDLAAWF